MNVLYDSMIAHYNAITERYQSIVQALQNEETCDWAQIEQWIGENTRFMELLPPIEAGMELQDGEIASLKSTVELLLGLQDKAVASVMNAKESCGKNIHKQRSVQKVLQAYITPQDNTPQFQDKTL